MLRWAGLGVAVDNADDVAKQAAALVGPRGDKCTSFARAVAAVFDHVAHAA